MRLRLPMLALAFGLVGCLPTTTVNRAPPARDSKKTPQPPGGEADADAKAKKGTPGDANYCASVKDEGHGSLRPYLFTPAEACKVSPWAFPYQAAKTDTPETRQPLPNSESIRAYMEDFLNRAVALKATKPGRTFHVRIMVDEEKNAYADGRQNLVVNSAFLEDGINTEHILGVLCHEMAHSLRNDFSAVENLFENVIIDDPDKNPVAKKIYDEIDAYFTRTYNDRTKTYTHDKARFEAILPAWRAYRLRYWDFSKRLEASADVIGGGICASLGMDPVSLRGVFEDLKAGDTESRSVSDLQTGEQFEAKPDEIFGWIFTDDTHPSDDERIAEVARLDDFFRSYLAADHKLLDEWNTKFPVLLKQSGIASTTSLTDKPLRAKGTIRLKNKQTGEIITFPYHPAPRRH